MAKYIYKRKRLVIGNFPLQPANSDTSSSSESSFLKLHQGAKSALGNQKGSEKLKDALKRHPVHTHHPTPPFLISSSSDSHKCDILTYIEINYLFWAQER